MNLELPNNRVGPKSKFIDVVRKNMQEFGATKIKKMETNHLLR